jgi:hypothetical protein
MADNILRVDPTDDSAPQMEFRRLSDGRIVKRALRPDGSEFDDGSSEWHEVTAGEVAEQLETGGKVADWLRNFITSDEMLNMRP